MNEHLLNHLWRGQAFDRGIVPCADGAWVQIVYRGRPNPHDGPDFLDAIIATPDGTLLHGNVELHVRTGDWRTHGHHGDPRFNSVVLHVVWEDDGSLALRQDGTCLPTAVLGKLPLSHDWESGALAFLSPPQLDPCRQRSDEAARSHIDSTLDTAGEQRFFSKAAVFEGDLACRPSEEVLYAGLMESLGYSRNRDPFRQLAQGLPFQVLSAFAAGKAEPETVMLALLLGTAGLLPARQAQLPVPEFRAPPMTDETDPDADYAAALRDIWLRSGLQPALSPASWRRARVRPENLPGRRLAGMAALLSRNLESGLLSGVLEVLRCGPHRAPTRLRRFCEVSSHGYWRSHLEPDQPLAGPVPALIGAGRAAEIVVNVLLPFARAYGQHCDDDLVSQRALEIYRAHAATQSNHVTRQMTDQLWGNPYAPHARSARRQQGLLHLFNQYCRQRRCPECPAAQQPA